MKNPMDAESVLKFFEDNSGVKFIDVSTKKPVLEVIAQNKTKEKKSDYDLWLERQDESVKLEHEIGAI